MLSTQFHLKTFLCIFNSEFKILENIKLFLFGRKTKLFQVIGHRFYVKNKKKTSSAAQTRSQDDCENVKTSNIDYVERKKKVSFF